MSPRPTGRTCSSATERRPLWRREADALRRVRDGGGAGRRWRVPDHATTEQTGSGRDSGPFPPCIAPAPPAPVVMIAPAAGIATDHDAPPAARRPPPAARRPPLADRRRELGAASGDGGGGAPALAPPSLTGTPARRAGRRTPLARSGPRSDRSRPGAGAIPVDSPLCIAPAPPAPMVLIAPAPHPPISVESSERPAQRRGGAPPRPAAPSPAARPEPRSPPRRPAARPEARRPGRRGAPHGRPCRPAPRYARRGQATDGIT
jgi:hypothetical protein